MKLSLTLLLGIFSLANLAMGDTNCADATGQLQYSQWNYDGGAPPPVGMIDGKETWTHDSIVIGYTEYRVGEQAVQSDLNAGFTGVGKPVAEYVDGDRRHTIQNYQVTLSRKSGGPVYENGPTVLSVYMMCDRAEDTIPKP